MSEDDDSRRVRILHQCDEHTVIGEENGAVRVLHPVTEGKTIPPGSNVVGFRDINEPGYMEMKTLYRVPGPSKVNSKQYKAGWDVVFNKRKPASSEDVN